MKALWITGYSDSHAKLYDKHFKPSFDYFLGQHFELQTRAIKGKPGKFGEKSFNDMGKTEMARILVILKANMGRFVVSTGVDFHFYDNFYAELKQSLFCKDLAGINDIYGPLCGDFAAFAVTPRIIALYEWMIDNDSRFSNQQFTFNDGIATLGLNAVQLPDTFYTVGMTNGAKVWRPGNKVNPPRKIKLHHGNFTIGAADKLALLDAVYDRMTAPIL